MANHQTRPAVLVLASCEPDPIADYLGRKLAQSLIPKEQSIVSEVLDEYVRLKAIEQAANDYLRTLGPCLYDERCNAINLELQNLKDVTNYGKNERN